MKDLKLITKKLEDSELRLSLALDVANIGVWDWSVEDNYLYWDSKMFSLFGITPLQFNNTYESFLSLVSDSSKQLVDTEIQNSLKNVDHKYNICYTLINDTVIKGIGKVIRDKVGNPIRMIGVCMNIDATCPIHM